MIFNGLVGLLSRIKSAGSDDRNAVIGCFSRVLTSNKTKSSYKMLNQKGVGGNISLYLGTSDSAVHVSEFTAINSLSKLIKSRLGIIRFLSNGEMGDLDRQQIMQQFNEIDNQVERIENEVNNYRRRFKSVYKKAQQSKANNLFTKSVSMTMTILQKYSQMLKDKAVIDESMDAMELDKFIFQLQPNIQIPTIEECEICE